MKPIPNFLGYFIDKGGNVYSYKRKGRPYPGRAELSKEPIKLKTYAHKGCDMVRLRKNDKDYHKSIHSLLLETFVSPRPKGMWACHGAKGRNCNSLDNLYWATPSQNAMDKYRDGTMLNGEKSVKAILNEFQVRIIKKIYSPRGKDGVSGADLARIFKVSTGTISQIIVGNSWQHIGEQR